MSYELRERQDGVILTPSAAAPTASVIWLHGLGASGEDFVPIVPQLGLPPTLSVRFVFPHAPVRAVTMNQGFRMRAWYDIRQISSGAIEDAAGIEASAASVGALIGEQTAQGIASHRIVLAGFSQGGAMALHVGTRFAAPLAGILALSTYLPLRDRLAAEASKANCQIPILMCHGRSDPMLPLQIGLDSRDILLRQGYAVQWKEYAMAHQVCDQEIRDIGQWLGDRLA